MIARIWRGAVRREDGDAYAEYMDGDQRGRLLGATPGNLGVTMLRRDVGDRCEFLMFSLWESLDAVKAFAGEDHETAVFYPEDDRFLIERDETSSHWEVAARWTATGEGPEAAASLRSGAERAAPPRGFRAAAAPRLPGGAATGTCTRGRRSARSAVRSCGRRVQQETIRWNERSTVFVPSLLAGDHAHAVDVAGGRGHRDLAGARGRGRLVAERGEVRAVAHVDVEDRQVLALAGAGDRGDAASAHRRAGRGDHHVAGRGRRRRRTRAPCRSWPS